MGDIPHSFQTHMPSRMTRDEFVAAFGGVYEHSAWIAEAVWDRGLDSRHDTAASLAAEMRDIVELAGREPQLALLRAHPDLAGKLAVAGALTEESGSEQSSAGLDQCTEDEFEEFQRLNGLYGGRFGFPFILAVSGHRRAAILENFHARVDNDAEAEFDEALRQVHRIARIRLTQID